MAGELPARTAAQPAAAGRNGRLARRRSRGSVHDYARATVYAGLSAWAWEELTDGVNCVRRALGAAGLVYVVVRVGTALGR